MKRDEYLESAVKAFNEGKISQEAYDAVVMNADLFSEESEEEWDDGVLECEAEEPSEDMKQPVDVICYGQRQRFATRAEAVDFYREGMFAAEGSERERYTKIYVALLESSSPIVSDGESERKAEIFDRVNKSLTDRIAEAESLTVAEDKPDRKLYDVTITETLKMTVQVEADNLEDAEMLVGENWHKGEYILDADHFTDVEFKGRLNAERTNAFDER